MTEATTATARMRKNMMVFTGNFLVQFSCASADRNNHGLGRWSGDRRAVIGEGADTRQVAIQRTGDRGASQHEGKGNEKS